MAPELNNTIIINGDGLDEEVLLGSISKKFKLF